MRIIELTESFDVLTLPFVEGPPSVEKAKRMDVWIRSHSDLYKNEYVKMYHGTDPALPIETEGLLPTSYNRRRSYQSTSGFVYLAATPERAKAFGDIGCGCKSAVYEVTVLVRKLLPDKDQLLNQYAVGNNVKNTVGYSIIYGGGARVKGAIQPWQIKRIL